MLNDDLSTTTPTIDMTAQTVSKKVAKKPKVKPVLDKKHNMLTLKPL